MKEFLLVFIIYFLQHAVNWVSSQDPLDTKLYSYGDSKRVSAGRYYNLCIHTRKHTHRVKPTILNSYLCLSHVSLLSRLSAIYPCCDQY